MISKRCTRQLLFLTGLMKKTDKVSEEEGGRLLWERQGR